MVNPDKYIRGAYVTALQAATGLPVWDTAVPKDTEPLPDKYIIVSGQSKARSVVSKQNWEWDARITVDIMSVSELGYHSTASVDDIEQAVLTAIEGGLSFGAGLNNKSTRFVDAVSLPIDTQTNTINRKVVIYEHWLNKAV